MQIWLNKIDVGRPRKKRCNKGAQAADAHGHGGTVHAARELENGEVAHGEDVRPAELEYLEHLHRPVAQTLDGGKALAQLRFAQHGEVDVLQALRVAEVFGEGLRRQSYSR